MAITKSWKTQWVARAEGVAGAFFAEIGEARRHDEMSDVWFCPVSIAAIFENEKQIAGVDAQQALDLSLQFVRTVFENNGADLNSFEVRRVDDDDASKF